MNNKKRRTQAVQDLLSHAKAGLEGGGCTKCGRTWLGRKRRCKCAPRNHVTRTILSVDQASGVIVYAYGS